MAGTQERGGQGPGTIPAEVAFEGRIWLTHNYAPGAFPVSGIVLAHRAMYGFKPHILSDYEISLCLKSRGMPQFKCVFLS